MKAKDFGALVGGLGSLTLVQHKAWMAALTMRGSAGDVAALIGVEFAKVAGLRPLRVGDILNNWGVATGLRRYRCASCNRMFNALTGTLLTHSPEAREEVARLRPRVVDGLSLRKATKRVGVLETSFGWRHRLLATSKDAKAKAFRGVVEADEPFILELTNDRRGLSVEHPGNAAVQQRRGASRRTSTIAS